MSRLYPPNIEGTIPAFYGTTLAVPFSMNRAVSKNQVLNLMLKIKNVYNGTLLGTFEAFQALYDPVGQAFFDLSDLNLEVGQHYKLQLAYIDVEDGKPGYYSTVGVVKHTAQPEVTIANLEAGQTNMHQYDYVGVYKNEDDTSEKAYSYKFDLYDADGLLLNTSGEMIHNFSLDTEVYESTDSYTIEHDLELNKTYFLEYTVTTTNGLVQGCRYRVMQKKTIDPEIKADLVASVSQENGYVDINLVGQRDANGVEYAATGAFKILRSSEEDGYGAWNEVLRFTLYGQQPSRWIWKDFTVKQGVTYKYALQQYNDNGLNSNRVESNPVYADFEHAFLYDGERQLKIKYNPKVSTFKNDILESKLDTIGSKHPFIFRNGNVKYKEFPISGLISCQLDEEFLFIKEDQLGRYDGTINLTGENIASEREFKLEVLEWLNNGKPKLFRSPTEGNYIVRLLNVSLSPNDTVGRMLHTFTATAYEIADYTYHNLSEYGMIQVEDPTIEQLRWETVDIAKSGLGNNENLLKYKAVSLYFEGMIPGDILTFTMVTNKSPYTLETFDVVIGVTGSYVIDLSLGVEVVSVAFKGSLDNVNADFGIVQHQGSLTYAYYSRAQNKFDSIRDVDIETKPLVQFIGKHNIMDEIQDVKKTVLDIYWIHAMLREVLPAYRKNTYYYQDAACTNRLDNFDAYVLYQIKDLDTGASFYLDGYSKERYSIEDYSTTISFNGNNMNLKETAEYTIKNPKDIKSINTSIGIMVEMAYQEQTLEYGVEYKEELYPELVEQKAIVEEVYKELHDAIYTENQDADNIETLRQRYNREYNRYIILLEEALEAEQEAQGDVAI